MGDRVKQRSPDIRQSKQQLITHLSSEAVCMCREVLTTVMRKHQRYFPVLDAAGHLLPHFVTVANGFINTAQVPTTLLPVFDNCPSAPHSSLYAAEVIMAACAQAASGSSWAWPAGWCC